MSVASVPRQDKPLTGEGLACRKCGYLFRGIGAEGTCPECGVSIRTSDPALVPWVEHPNALKRLKLAARAMIVGMMVALPIRLMTAGMVNGFLFGYEYGRAFWPYFNLFAGIMFGYGLWQLWGWREENWKWRDPPGLVFLWRFLFVFWILPILFSSSYTDRIGYFFELPYWLIGLGKSQWEFRRFFQVSESPLTTVHLLLCALLAALFLREGYLYWFVDRTSYGQSLFEIQWRTDVFFFMLAWVVLGTLMFWISVERLGRRIKRGKGS